MEIDPHTLHLLLEKIHQQLMCPQCMKKVEMQLDHLQVVGDIFLVFQSQCDSCGAHVVLHTTISSLEEAGKRASEGANVTTTDNASTLIHKESEEIDHLRTALEGVDGNFSDLFAQQNKAV